MVKKLLHCPIAPLHHCNIASLKHCSIVPLPRKAQVKIQQTAFMLIALTILFVMVGMFLLSSSFSSLEDEAAKLKENNALKLVSSLANVPELACGDVFGGERSNCVDFDKALVFSQKSEGYASFWGIQGLEIIKVHPFSEKTCTDSNYPECGFLTLIEHEGKTLGNDRSTFISLCRKEGTNGGVYDKCELAKLSVRYSDDE